METMFTGQFQLRLDAVSSTNSYALEALRNSDLPEGTLIMAASQTGGRGQRGNSWESEPGKNLTISIILKPHFLSLDRQFDLTRAVSLAVSDLVSGLLPATEVKIKWPNDILAGGKKISGILIENVIREKGIQASVAGIGLNVNQEQFGGAPHASSLKLLAGKEFDLKDLTDQLCSAVESRYLQLRAGKSDRLAEEYHERMFRRNEKQQLRAGDRVFEAFIRGTSPEGLLLTETAQGPRNFRFQEVSWVL